VNEILHRIVIAGVNAGELPCGGAEASRRDEAVARGLLGNVRLGIHEVQIPMDFGSRGIEQRPAPAGSACRN
jgi:hypothetical protein